MMNIILTKLHRFGRIRQLHTIISQETIKPSSPTPSHLKTHNLSVIDKYLQTVHAPLIFFYKNYNNGDINILKKSLSQCLTHYYPFAGRLPTILSPHVNCNDEGVEFLEAYIDSRLDDFVVKKEQDETLDQLVPHSLGCAVNKTSTSIVEVQLNHFACGGVALAVSIAHKLADAFTMVNFINHWATVTRGEMPPVKLSFSSSSYTSSPSIGNYETPELEVEATGKVKYVTRSFLFSNSKLNELKNKINAMGTSTPVNPTRVDSLTALIFKCAMDAATTKSGSSQQSNLMQLVNLRGSQFPKLGAGNMIGIVNTTVPGSCEVELNDVITCLRKERMELQGVRDMEEIEKKWANILLAIGEYGRSRTYVSSSICRFPVYQVDFGWGNPVRAVIRFGNVDASNFIFMDTPSGDGIEATAHLEEEVMAIFQEDKDILAYTQDI